LGQDRILERLERASLEQTEIRSRSKRFGLVPGIHGQDDDPYLWPLIFDASCGFQAVHHGHLDIHQYHIRVAFCDQAYGIGTPCCLANHLHLRREPQQALQAFSYWLLIIDNQNANLAHLETLSLNLDEWTMVIAPILTQSRPDVIGDPLILASTKKDRPKTVFCTFVQNVNSICLENRRRGAVIAPA
jgi:hypothetical protein